MGNDPDTSEDATLEDPVEGPGKEGEGGGEVRDVGGGEVVEDGGYGEVRDNIGEGAEDRALEAVGRDGLLYLAEGEGRFCTGHTFRNISLCCCWINRHSTTQETDD